MKLNKVDSQIANLIKKEAERQKNGLVMIPSENFASPAVLEAIGSVLTNKYAEGYPGRRYYSGNQFIDQIENLAIERAKKLFGAEHANVQPHAGVQANMAVYFALLKPGDKILGMDLSCGGHLSHGSQMSFSGKLYNFIHYGVRQNNQQIDYDEVRQIALRERPKMIISGASSYPRQIDFKTFGQIAKEVGAYHLADIAHIAGLIAAKVHPDAIPYSDVVTTTTHKTLRGPRGAIILCQKKYAKEIDKSVFPGSQGGPAENIIAAKAVCFKEALSVNFRKYQKQIIKNARALADSLLANGLKLISGGTDNHLLLIDLTPLNISGKIGQNLLEEVGIYVNRNVIPYDQRKPFDPSGLRLGTPALTTRGMKEKEMKIIGKCIAQILLQPNNAKIKKETQKIVKELTKSFPLFY